MKYFIGISVNKSFCVICHVFVLHNIIYHNIEKMPSLAINNYCCKPHLVATSNDKNQHVTISNNTVSSYDNCVINELLNCPLMIQFQNYLFGLIKNISDFFLQGIIIHLYHP